MSFAIDRHPGLDQQRLEHAQRRVRPDPAADRVDQRTRVDLAFLKLSLRVRLGHDPASDTEPQVAVVRLEGADGDVELEAGVGARVADRAGSRPRTRAATATARGATIAPPPAQRPAGAKGQGSWRSASRTPL